jgi:hypothetical protein
MYFLLLVFLIQPNKRERVSVSSLAKNINKPEETQPNRKESWLTEREKELLCSDADQVKERRGSFLERKKVFSTKPRENKRENHSFGFLEKGGLWWSFFLKLCYCSVLFQGAEKEEEMVLRSVLNEGDEL